MNITAASGGSLKVHLKVCAQLTSRGYMLLNINDTDHDAASLAKQHPPPTSDADSTYDTYNMHYVYTARPLGDGGGENSEKSGECWLADFADVSVGVGVHALQFSARDEELEAVGLESSVCYIHIRKECLVAYSTERDQGNFAFSPGGEDAINADDSDADTHRCCPRSLKCLVEHPLIEAGGSWASFENGKTTLSADPPHTHQEPIEAEWQRFEKFMSVVCEKCEKRGVSCGCESVGEVQHEGGGGAGGGAGGAGGGGRSFVTKQHPAFVMLSDFTRDMLAQRAYVAQGGGVVTKRPPRGGW